MTRVYMQRTVPVWNHWRTPAAFVLTSILLGGLTANALLWSFGDPGGEPAGRSSFVALSWIVLIVVLAQQTQRRRDYFARYERTGV